MVMAMMMVVVVVMVMVVVVPSPHSRSFKCLIILAGSLYTVPTMALILAGVPLCPSA